jgi:hypothetical protein
LVQNLTCSHVLSQNLEIRIYKNFVLPAVLYGCETWSLTLREEHRLKEFENRELRRIFGSNNGGGGGMAGGLRWMHSKVLNNFYTSPNRMIKSRMASCMGKMRNVYKILV